MHCSLQWPWLSNLGIFITQLGGGEWRHAGHVASSCQGAGCTPVDVWLSLIACFLVNVIVYAFGVCTSIPVYYLHTHISHAHQPSGSSYWQLRHRVQQFKPTHTQAGRFPFKDSLLEYERDHASVATVIVWARLTHLDHCWWCPVLFFFGSMVDWGAEPGWVLFWCATLRTNDNRWYWMFTTGLRFVSCNRHFWWINSWLPRKPGWAC